MTTARSMLVASASLTALCGAAAAFGYDEDIEFHRPGPGANGEAMAHVEALEEGRADLAQKVTEMVRPGEGRRAHAARPEEVRTQVEQVMSAARAHGEVSLLAARDVPFRDCAQCSAGGATSVEEDRAWIDGVAEGIGDAIVILEPDGLAIIPFATMADGSLGWCRPEEADPEAAEAVRSAMTE